MAKSSSGKSDNPSRHDVLIPDIEDMFLSPPNGEVIDALAEHYKDVLVLLGEDPSREGLIKTPRRVAESLKFLTAGYYQDIETIVGDAVFEDKCDEMVMVRDIELYSLCEHHLLPFYGRCHVAYIPNGKILGLSKLPRIVDVYARRLQVQERLTNQIADTVQEILEPRGVGVVIEAYHLCMMMRGVQKQNSKTVTSAMRGGFKRYSKTRMEFLRLIDLGSGMD
jgi:GTP cyclohydrolase I